MSGGWWILPVMFFPISSASSCCTGLHGVCCGLPGRPDVCLLHSSLWSWCAAHPVWLVQTVPLGWCVGTLFVLVGVLPRVFFLSSDSYGAVGSCFWLFVLYGLSCMAQSLSSLWVFGSLGYAACCCFLFLLCPGLIAYLGFFGCHCGTFYLLR